MDKKSNHIRRFYLTPLGMGRRHIVARQYVASWRLRPMRGPPRLRQEGFAWCVVSYNKEAGTLRIWDGNNEQPITQEVFAP